MRRRSPSGARSPRADGNEVRAAGGLYVLGTERHDSRRIDNQLRGRSGRQGDPGESRFYLSLEDELLRIFATGAVSWVMDRTMPENEPIEAKMVSRAIERAQNTVEARNAEIRKDVLKYDEVMNEQRKVIYKRRQQVIDGEDIHDATIELIEEQLTNVVDQHVGTGFSEEWDLNALLLDLQSYYPTELDLDTLTAYDDVDDLVALVVDEAVQLYEKKSENFPGGLDTAKDDRARRDAPDPRPALAGPPLGDGLPTRRHPPTPGRPAGPPHRVAEGGVLDV